MPLWLLRWPPKVAPLPVKQALNPTPLQPVPLVEPVLVSIGLLLPREK